MVQVYNGQPDRDSRRHENHRHEGVDSVRHGLAGNHEGGMMATDVVSVDVPMTFRKRGGPKVIVLPDGTQGNPVPRATRGH